MGMLKISKSETINDLHIEAFGLYGSKPLVRIAANARTQGRERRIFSRYGLKSIAIMEDGYVFLCPKYPSAYLAKLGADDWLAVERNRYFIRKQMVREISSKLTSGQKREVAEAKRNGMYVNFSRNKRVKYHVFTLSGRVYGIQYITHGLQDTGGGGQEG